MVGGWAPGVRRITNRVLFHSMTGLTACARFTRDGSAVAAIEAPVTWAWRLAHRRARVTKTLDISFIPLFGFGARPGSDMSHCGLALIPSRTGREAKYSRQGCELSNFRFMPVVSWVRAWSYSLKT